MEGHKGTRGRPTSLGLNISTDNSSKMGERRSPRNSPDIKSPSRLLGSGPPPGFGAIPNIQISPPSPRSFGSSTPEWFTQSPTNFDPHEQVRRRVNALLEGFAKSKKLELSILSLVEASFPGEKVEIFLDTLSRQVLCDGPSVSGQRIPAMLIRALIVRGSILESTVLDTISNGVIKDLGNLLVLPQGTGDLAGFLTDLFLAEPDLKWLLSLTNNVPRQSAISGELIHGVIESLKLRMPLAEVQNRIKNTLEHGWQ